MSVDYFVALHAANWPTMQAVQQCIDQRGWPVRLGTKDDPRWPFDKIQGSLRVSRFGYLTHPAGVPVEASLVTLSPTESFGYSFDRPPDFRTKETEVYNVRPEDKLKPRDINETLARIGASGVRFEYGDKVFSLSFYSNRKEWQAGFYIMAALIKCFQGYGFELQGGEHGTSDYADELLREVPELKAR